MININEKYLKQKKQDIDYENIANKLMEENEKLYEQIRILKFHVENLSKLNDWQAHMIREHRWQECPACYPKAKKTKKKKK